MSRQLKRFITILSIAFILPALAWGGNADRWVSSSRATLKAEPKASSETLKKFSVGDKVTVSETSGRWVLVKTSDGMSGWVYGGRLAKAAPEKETAKTGGLLGGVLAKSSISTAKADSSRSIRGLSPETEAYANNRQTPKEIRTSLDDILAYNVTANELDQFLADGKIGEYAE